MAVGSGEFTGYREYSLFGSGITERRLTRDVAKHVSLIHCI